MDRRDSSREPENSRSNPRCEGITGPDDPPGARGNGGRDSGLPGNGWWTSDRISRLAVCGLLLLAVGLVFGQTAGFGFVYDDNDVCLREPARDARPRRPTGSSGR